MLNIGCHLSIAKGFEAIGKDAVSIGANTFQFFTRNPRGGKARVIDPEDVKVLRGIMETQGFAQILAHAPYTLNPCSADERTREFAFEAMTDDLARMELLPGNLYNFHPGSHVGQGVEKGIQMIIQHLNAVLFPNMKTTVLLETMSGKGSEVGGRFEELRAIIDGVTLRDKVGVCLDLCHVFDGGYDIVNNLEGVLAEFDAVIGLDRLKAIHVNDSMNTLGSHKDRHAKIGQGSMGLDTIVNVINHPRLRTLPFNLETPNEMQGHKEEIALLRSLYIE